MFQVILNKQTPKVESVIDLHSDEETYYINEFFKYSKKRKDAIGLAANQLSYNGERFMKRAFAMRPNGEWELIINPEILDYIGDSEYKKESCLTWPYKYVISQRFEEIKVSYLDIKNKEVVKKIHGLESQVFQHEYDHLEGIEEEIIKRDHFTYKREKSKINRNSSCPCGSTDKNGKKIKYKKCCGRKSNIRN